MKNLAFEISLHPCFRILLHAHPSGSLISALFGWIIERGSILPCSDQCSVPVKERERATSVLEPSCLQQYFKAETSSYY